MIVDICLALILVVTAVALEIPFVQPDNFSLIQNVISKFL